MIGPDTQEILPFLGPRRLDGLTFDWYASEAKAETDIPNEIKFSGEDHVDPATGEVLSTSIRRSDFGGATTASP